MRIELSPKVLDCEARLRCTLAHEMCHVAAWVLEEQYAPHHGSAFWHWAARCMDVLEEVNITRLHNFAVHAPYRWTCTK